MAGDTVITLVGNLVDDPELRFIHLRPMGSSQQSIYTGRKRQPAEPHVFCLACWSSLTFLGPPCCSRCALPTAPIARST